MSDPHTLASFAALPDDASRDAAMARAVGWRLTTRMEPDRCEHEPGHGYSIPCWVRGDVGPEPERDDPNVWWCDTPPPIFTGGDGDPFANWHLLAEVVRLVCDAVAGPRGRDVAMGYATLRLALDLVRDRHTVSPDRRMTCQSHTPHRAACHAAVAAGLVPREEA